MGHAAAPARRRYHRARRRGRARRRDWRGRARLATVGAFGETGAGRLYALTSRVRAFLYAPALRERLGDFTPAHDHAWDEARLAAWHPLHRSLCALKLRGGQDKWVLRQLAARLLARDVSRRPKHMFRAEPVIHAPGRPA